MPDVSQPRLKWQRALTVKRLEFIRKHLDKTDAVIAQKLGVCRQAVHSLRRKYKIAKVHGSIQRVQRRVDQIRRLKPGLTSRAAAQQLGVSQARATALGKLAGYRFLHRNGAKHFQWRERLKALPPLLTLAAVTRKLGVSYGYAALLCHRHKYKVTIPERYGQRPRVPIRNYLRRPKHERWLASLKPAKA